MIESLYESHRFMMADMDRTVCKGFMYATVEQFDGENSAFIQACYSEEDGNVQNMLDKLIVWAKKLNLRKLVFMTKRNPDAWHRKYKFNPIYTVMQREL